MSCRVGGGGDFTVCSVSVNGRFISSNGTLDKSQGELSQAPGSSAQGQLKTPIVA